MDWSSISDTGFVVLAAGTAAVGALVSLASYYLFGQAAPAPATPAATPAKDDTSTATPSSPAKSASVASAAPSTASASTKEDEEGFVMVSPHKKPKTETAPRGSTISAASPSSSSSSSSPSSTLQVPASGSAILVSPVKERARPATRTLPSRGHHKARPAVDPQSTFHQTLLEQQQQALQQRHEENVEPERGAGAASPSATSASSAGRSPAPSAGPAGRGRGAPMGIGGQGMNMSDLMAARARMRKADQ